LLRSKISIVLGRLTLKISLCKTLQWQLKLLRNGLKNKIRWFMVLILYMDTMLSLDKDKDYNSPYISSPMLEL
jgi:hypothetical protein